MGGNILDLVLTSDPERGLEIDSHPPLRNVNMGHSVISVIFGMCLEDEKEPKQTKRDVLGANFKGINEEISKVDWESYLNGLELDEAYKRFLHVYEKIWNKCVPLKR